MAQMVLFPQAARPSRRSDEPFPALLLAGDDAAALEADVEDGDQGVEPLAIAAEGLDLVVGLGAAGDRRLAVELGLGRDGRERRGVEGHASEEREQARLAAPALRGADREIGIDPEDAVEPGAERPGGEEPRQRGLAEDEVAAEEGRQGVEGDGDRPVAPLVRPL
jgi:hypothetical protein